MTCPHCEHPNEVMWPTRGICSVDAPPSSKLKRWLSRKYEYFTMRRFLKRHRAEVECQVREQFRGVVQEFGETGPSEEELMAWFKCQQLPPPTG